MKHPAAHPLRKPHYYIVVTALDVPRTGVPNGASPALVLFETLDHVVARARLVPRYGV